MSEENWSVTRRPEELKVEQDQRDAEKFIDYRKRCDELDTRVAELEAEKREFRKLVDDADALIDQGNEVVEAFKEQNEKLAAENRELRKDNRQWINAELQARLTEAERLLALYADLPHKDGCDCEVCAFLNQKMPLDPALSETHRTTLPAIKPAEESQV